MVVAEGRAGDCEDVGAGGTDCGLGGRGVLIWGIAREGRKRGEGRRGGVQTSISLAGSWFGVVWCGMVFCSGWGFDEYAKV